MSVSRKEFAVSLLRVFCSVAVRPHERAVQSSGEPLTRTSPFRPFPPHAQVLMDSGAMMNAACGEVPFQKPDETWGHATNANGAGSYPRQDIFKQADWYESARVTCSSPPVDSSPSTKLCHDFPSSTLFPSSRRALSLPLSQCLATSSATAQPGRHLRSVHR